MLYINFNETLFSLLNEYFPRQNRSKFLNLLLENSYLLLLKFLRQTYLNIKSKINYKIIKED